MSFDELTNSGQPKNVYTHPRRVSEFIYRQLGVYIGFLYFQHNFQGLVDLLIHLKLLRTMEDEDERMGYNMLVNEHNNKPIKTKLDREALAKLEQVWERGGYLLTRYAKVDDNFVDIQEEIYLYEYPNWELGDNEEVSRIPALFSMNSKDESTSEKILRRINEGVPEREAYRNHNPKWLCENAHLEYEKDGILIPYFKTPEDIDNSTYYTNEVPVHYYDLMTTIAWRESLIWLNRLHVNSWKMAQEMEMIDVIGLAKTTAKRKKMLSA